MRGSSRPILLRVLAFARPYWRRIMRAWIGVGSPSVFVLLMPRLLRWAIDTGLDPQMRGGALVATGDKQTLILIGLAIVGTAVARGIFACDIRNSIYDHLQRLSFAYHDQ